MSIQGILLLALAGTATIAIVIAWAASRPQLKPPARTLLIWLVSIWCVASIVGGLALKRLIGPIMVAEGFLLAAAPAMALITGSFLCSKGSRPRALAGLCAALGLLDLAAFYAMNHRVVAIAAELGIGSTSSAKYSPQADKDCPDNLQSLYFALAQYVDGNGALPPAEKWMENDEIVSKVQKDEWLHCPAVSNRHDANFGYAYNDSIAGRKMNGKKLGEMPNAGSTPLLYDSTNLAKSAHDAVTTLPRPGRHAGKNEILYCDGHVAAVAP